MTPCADALADPPQRAHWPPARWVGITLGAMLAMVCVLTLPVLEDRAPKIAAPPMISAACVAVCPKMTA